MCGFPLNFQIENCEFEDPPLFSIFITYINVNHYICFVLMAILINYDQHHYNMFQWLVD
jgi:general stress protein CsbA